MGRQPVGGNFALAPVFLSLSPQLDITRLTTKPLQNKLVSPVQYYEAAMSPGRKISRLPSLSFATKRVMQTIQADSPRRFDETQMNSSPHRRAGHPADRGRGSNFMFKVK